LGQKSPDFFNAGVFHVGAASITEPRRLAKNHGLKLALQGGAGFQPAISGVAPEIVRRSFRLEPGKVRAVSAREIRRDTQ
jgi:hypothetical protein